MLNLETSQDSQNVSAQHGALVNIEIEKHPFDSAFILAPQHSNITFNQLVHTLDNCFAQNKTLSHLQLPKKLWETHQGWQYLMQMLLSESFSRAEFYQLAAIWLKSRSAGIHSSNHTAESVYCPNRPNSPKGEVYRRFDPVLGKTISFRTLDITRDLSQFHRWMNDPRVAFFWEQAWSLPKLEQYLITLEANHNTLPLIGYFNDKPFGYFEVYWAAEDRIAPYYAWQAFDRGIHLLVGENEFRGENHFVSWLNALSHFIYLDEPLTKRIVLEPRVDNSRLFNHIEKVGYQIQYEFDFPHKRSALVMGTKDNFYKDIM